MNEYLEHEHVDCSSAKELRTALEGDKLAIKSISCRRINKGISEIIEFVNLENCDLSMCKATAFAEEIGELKELKSVSFQACKLSEFPIAMTSLPKLESLSLGNNKIKTIPAEIGNLHSLTDLFLAQNELQQIPDSLFELPLKELSLSRNRLKAIPESISGLKELEYLVLDYNKLMQLPKSIGDLRKLAYLSLTGCGLDSLPDELLRLKQLKNLDLRNNKFTSLPRGLEAFSASLDDFSIDGKHRSLFTDWTYKHSDNPVQLELAEMGLCMDDSVSGFKGIAKKLGSVGAVHLKTQIRNSINIKSSVPDDYSQPGCSRMGGFPDLTDEIQLPRCDDGIWIFLFQINLADIAGLNSYLPNSGLLSFFVKSLEEVECKVIFFDGDADQLSTVRFGPKDLTDDQDDYTATPFHVEFAAARSLPHVYVDGGDDKQAKFDSIFKTVNTVGDHCLNGYTFTQHESPETQAANKMGGTPEEWVSLLKLGYDKQVGFCFWDAGTLTFTIHQEDLRRVDFSNVQVSLESS